MGISFWRLLVVVGIITGYLPAIRFRNHRYFIFFAISSLIDPLYIFLRMIHLIGNFYYIPFFLAVSLAVLPGRFKRERVLAGIAVFLLSFHFLNSMESLRIIAALLSAANAVFLINENLEVVRKESKVKLFLALLALNMLIHGGSIFLYFENIGLYTNYYSLFLILDIASFALIAWAGPEKAINVRLRLEPETEQPASESVPELKAMNSSFITVENHADNNGVHHLLTKKELEVFLYLCERLTNDEISKKLFVGKRTVESHLNHIKEKLGLQSIPELRKFVQNHSTKENISTN